MKHFFVKMQQPEWNWGTPNVLPLPNCKDKQKFEPNCFKCKLIFIALKKNFLLKGIQGKNSDCCTIFD